MSQAFIGEIKMFAGNFAPRGYAQCNGQTLPISANTALFSILGTTFGGNGISTFMLPDLQGRAPMGWGNGAGLTSRVLGETIGAESVPLSIANMPPHTTAVITLRFDIDILQGAGLRATGVAVDYPGETRPKRGSQSCMRPGRVQSDSTAITRNYL